MQVQGAQADRRRSTTVPRRARLRGGSTLTVLVAVSTTALMAVIARFAVLSPHEGIADALKVITAPIAGAPPAGRPFGACGDVCSAQHVCRHVVLRDGLHQGSRVSAAVLDAAEACY